MFSPPGSTMRGHTRWPLFLLAILSTLVSPSVAAGDTIAPGESLREGSSLVSADGSFRLGFFAPGSSKSRYLGIWYSNLSVRTYIWVANRDRPLPDTTGILSISRNGSLVLSDGKGLVYFSTEAASGLADPVARLLNNSNFVVTGSSGAPAGSYAWQSYDHPTDSLMSGMKLGWDLRTGKNRNITSWRSPDDPATGDYTMFMDVNGEPQTFVARGTAPVWRSGPWIGDRFSGIPEQESKAMFGFAYKGGPDEVYYQFVTLVNTTSPVVARVVVNQQTGGVQCVVWSESARVWNVFWSAPRDQCDRVNTCGPFGICDTSASTICRCVPGFDPRSPEDWYLGVLGDRMEGCGRRTPLDCRNGTDGFVKVPAAKLPDTSAVAVNRSMGLDECRAACLGNCSCTAYASALVHPAPSGCVLWGGNLTDIRVFNGGGGQDLFVRVAASDLGSSEEGKKGGVAAVAVVAPVLVGLLLVCVACCVWRRRRKRRKMRATLGTTTSETNTQMNEKSSGIGNDLELPVYDFRTIAAATDDFSAENKLGQGGFGPVYKGCLGEGQEVAVKRLSKNSVQGLDQFKNEVMLIAKLQHRNLVRLLGCCIQGDERMLIYEYMPNKSLDAFLFDRTNDHPSLDWKTRYHIISGVARGILYLHQDSRFRIIHRDLKAGNILLDKDMNPKISDFGMARICGGDETEANTRRVVGTYGYMSPEYIMDGIFSVKSDVFSFGVVVLEVVSGKRNRGMYLSDPNLNLLGCAWNLWKEGNGLELVDSSMAPQSFPTVEVLKCIKIGLLCVQERPEDRPAMASVVQMLGNDIALLPQPKPPGFTATRGPFEVVSSSTSGKLCSVNDVTFTMFEGR